MTSEEKTEKTIWHTLMSIPDNAIQVVFLLCMIVPLLVPMNIPYGVTPPVKAFYDTIYDLPEGGVVVFSMQLISFNYGDCAGATASIFNLLLNAPNHLRIVIIFPASNAPLMFDIMQKEYEILMPEWRTYGEDWVRFGYYAGMESGFATLCDNMELVYPEDYFGTPFDDLPIMSDITTAADWDLLIEVTSYTAIVDYEVRQAYAKYGVPCLFAPAGMTVMSVIPYYPHISKGFIMGLSGGAQLNALQGIEGTLVDLLGNSFSFMSLEAFILAVIGIVSSYMIGRKETT